MKVIIEEVFTESDKLIIVEFDKDGDLKLDIDGNEITIDYKKWKDSIAFLLKES